MVVHCCLRSLLWVLFSFFFVANVGLFGLCFVCLFVFFFFFFLGLRDDIDCLIRL